MVFKNNKLNSRLFIQKRLQFKYCGYKKDLKMQIAIRELKSHFSQYLKKVQTGEEIIVTTHGKPIARFSQFENNDILSVENSLENLSWLVKSNGKKPKGLSSKQRIKASIGKNLSELLLEDRE